MTQHLAALRMLFGWLIVDRIFSGFNPAAAVRAPKHMVKKRKTSALDGDEAKKLIDSIYVSTIDGLRDRAPRVTDMVLADPRLEVEIIQITS